MTGNRYIFVLLFFVLHAHCSHRIGVTAVPVADLVGCPLLQCGLADTTAASYQALPFCGADKSHARSCPRLHQLLLGEQVFITKETDDEYCIEVPHLFYLAYDTKKPQSTFWTLKKNIVPLEKITDKDSLPPLIDHRKSYTTLMQKGVITLLAPWKDPHSGIVYSAGTRFTYNPKKSKKNYYAVNVFNPQTHAFDSRHVPKECALTYQEVSPEKQQQQFVQLLKKWAHASDGRIAYVWGGCSFTTLYEPDLHTKKTLQRNEKTFTYFERPSKDQSAKTGLECAGLIIRAAQAVGLPYFYKNTTTLAECMQEIHKGEKVTAGDLIWIPGHVMAVSDVKYNLLIEARTYAHGYGYVHEAPLNKIFKDITTYDDLLTARQKKLVQRLKKDGTIADQFHEYKILRMSSIFNPNPICQER